MNLLNKNELLKLLDSPDIENRKIALSILKNKYDLDFYMWESLDKGPGLTYSFEKEVHILKYIIL